MQISVSVIGGVGVYESTCVCVWVLNQNKRTAAEWGSTRAPCGAGGVYDEVYIGPHNDPTSTKACRERKPACQHSLVAWRGHHEHTRSQAWFVLSHIFSSVACKSPISLSCSVLSANLWNVKRLTLETKTWNTVNTCNQRVSFFLCWDISMLALASSSKPVNNKELLSRL